MLSRCTKVHGFATSLAGEPRFTSYEDVLYVPLGTEGHNAGIFDRGRRLVTDAGCFHGLPSVHPGGGANGSFVSTINPDDVHEVVDEPMIFGGHLAPHYGHFLTSTLSRFWWAVKHDRAERRILILNREPAAQHFSRPFTSTCFSALGIAADHFAAFDRPVRITSLTIPAASFEENNLAYSAFGRMGNEIGKRVTSALPDVRLPPVYLSKSRLTSGINRFVNEAAFEVRLHERGFDIAYPETLTPREQIDLFMKYRLICGSHGSALHTSIFAPHNHLLVLNSSDEVCSNQILFDRANANDSDYVYSAETVNHHHDGNFHNNYILPDPTKMADCFADMALSHQRVVA